MKTEQTFAKLADLLAQYMAMTNIERQIFHIAYDKSLKRKQKVI